MTIERREHPMTVDRLLALGRDLALIMLSVAYLVVHF
jgi:hypothetical protein